MYRRNLLFAVLFGILAVATASTCKGAATYKVTFKNFLTRKKFGDLIPESGLVFSPLAGVSHSNRQSFFTIRGFASRSVADIAKTGSNRRFINRAGRLRERGRGVKTVAGADGPTMPGKSTTLKLKVNCKNPFITMLGMIAPSPDWIVQINNRNMYDMEKGRFAKYMSGDLIAYDAGVDDGREFTPPDDPSLDIPTRPVQNIAPLVEDETDRFEGRVVGRFFIRRIR